MDIPQARTLLQKITQLVDNVENSHGRGSRLERDLLLEYTRHLYDTFTTDTSNSDRPVSGKSTSPPASPESPVFVTPEPTVLLVGSKSDSAAPESDDNGSAAPASEDGSSSNHAETISESTDNTPPLAVSQPSTDNFIDSGAFSGSASEISSEAPAPVEAEQDASPLFILQEARDLGDKLRLSRIEDLSKAMGINERFLTINELFGGNHETFDRVLRHLNSLPSFDDARRYLEQEVIPQFSWMDDKKQKKATIFIQLVQRRYL